MRGGILNRFCVLYASRNNICIASAAMPPLLSLPLYQYLPQHVDPYSNILYLLLLITPQLFTLFKQVER